MRFALLLLFSLLLVGCNRDDASPAGSDALDLTTTMVSALDSLAGTGAQVSVNGQVIDQRAGSSEVVLDDGTGLIRVELPEAPPVLVGRRLFVQGTLRQDDGQPVIHAAEWLYDSTAVSVRSE